jgi:hypothetical protein
MRLSQEKIEDLRWIAVEIAEFFTKEEEDEDCWMGPYIPHANEQQAKAGIKLELIKQGATRKLADELTDDVMYNFRDHTYYDR